MAPKYEEELAKAKGVYNPYTDPKLVASQNRMNNVAGGVYGTLNKLVGDLPITQAATSVYNDIAGGTANSLRGVGQTIRNAGASAVGGFRKTFDNMFTTPYQGVGQPIVSGASEVVSGVAGTPPPQPTEVGFRKTSFEDRQANSLLYGEVPPQVVTPPVINEIPNVQRDKELGAMISSASVLPGGGQRNTYSVGGNNLSYNLSENDLAVKKSIEDIDARIAQGFEPTPEQATRIAELRQQAGYMRGGTDRRQVGGGARQIGNLDVQFDPSTPIGARQAFASRPGVTPTEEQLKQYDFQEGLKSGRTQQPTDPYAGLSNKAKRELLVQESRNRQLGLNNTADNAVASERNRIAAESNIGLGELRQANINLTNQQAKAAGNDKVVAVDEPIMTRDPNTGEMVPDLLGRTRTRQVVIPKDGGVPRYLTDIMKSQQDPAFMQSLSPAEAAKYATLSPEEATIMYQRWLAEKGSN